MEGEELSKGRASWEIGTLLNVEQLHIERGESPTPGLVEGTEPGAGQQAAMFVHSASVEDLEAEDEGGESRAGGPHPAVVDGEPGARDSPETPEDATPLQEHAPDEVGAPGESPCAGGRKREEDIDSAAWRDHRKHVFVLSHAGKPIYSRYGTEEAMSCNMGVMMALVSFVEADRNAIRSIHADGCNVVFLTKSPLVLVAVSRTRQSDKELTRELHYIYYQIVSLLTLTQLQHIYGRKQNYDLRHLLAGSEHLLDQLLRQLDRDPGPLLGAVTCLPVPSCCRDAVSSSLQAARARSLVFSILLAEGRLVSLVRQKDQFLHPVDLHLVFNLVGSGSNSFCDGEGWTPICLPKFNSASFFYAHVSYLEPRSELCLVLLSVDREDFFTMSDCKARFLERVSRRGALQALKEAVKTPSYPVEQVGIPELRHFLYKSRSSGLFTSPEFPCVYQSAEEQERLMSLYQELHSRLHHSTRPMLYVYRCGAGENLMAWLTSGFELYVCLTPLGTKVQGVAAVNKLLKWIRKEEDRLFILSPFTY